MPMNFDPKTREEYIAKRLERFDEQAKQKRERASYYMCSLCGMLTWFSSIPDHPEPGAVLIPEEDMCYRENNPCDVCNEFAFKHPEVYRMLGLVAGHHYGLALPSKAR